MSAESTATGPAPVVSIATIKAVAAELDGGRRSDLLAAARRTRVLSAEQAGDLSSAIHMADLRRDKPAPDGDLQERAVRELLQQVRMPTIAAIRRVIDGLGGQVDAPSRDVLLRVSSAILEGPAALPDEPEPEPEPASDASEPAADLSEPASDAPEPEPGADDEALPPQAPAAEAQGT